MRASHVPPLPLSPPSQLCAKVLVLLANIVISETYFFVHCTCSNTILDGLPCCDGTGDFAHRRDAHPRPCTDGLLAPQFLRNFAAPEGRRFQLSLNRDGSLVFFLRAVHGAAGERGERAEGGSRWLRNTGRCALTASRKKPYYRPWTLTAPAPDKKRE